MKHALRLCTAATAGLIALPAHADVTAEEVWRNWLAPFEALNATVEAEPMREGDRLVIDGYTAVFVLPLEAGELRLTTNRIEYVENGDGTVSIHYPQDFEMTIGLVLAEEELPPTRVSATFQMDTASYVLTARGEPGDVIYDYKLDDAAIRLTEFDLSVETGFELEFDMRMSGSRGSYRVTEGDLLRISTEENSAETAFDLTARYVSENFGETLEANSVYEMSQQYSGGHSTIDAVLPVGKLSIMNLSQGLRDGLSFEMAFATDSFASSTVETTNDEVISKDIYTSSENETTYRLDASGISIHTEAREFDYALEMAEVPVPVSVLIADVQGMMHLPVNKTDGVEDADIKLTLAGAELNEETWALIDPSAQMPRDPVHLSYDVTVSLESFLDWLDFTTLEQRLESTNTPVALHGLTLRDLTLDAVGVRLTGNAELNFDNTDFVTYDGIPAPDGVINMALEGGNGLLDTLVTMGLLPEDQAMGARTMMGMFAVPGDGEDTLNSKIEVKGNGQILANGQRIK